MHRTGMSPWAGALESPASLASTRDQTSAVPATPAGPTDRKTGGHGFSNPFISHAFGELHLKPTGGLRRMNKGRFLTARPCQRPEIALIAPVWRQHGAKRPQNRPALSPRAPLVRLSCTLSLPGLAAVQNEDAPHWGSAAGSEKSGTGVHV